MFSQVNVSIFEILVIQTLHKLLTGMQFLTDILNTTLSIFKVILRSNFKTKDLPRAMEDEIVILGNGPSLKTTLEHPESIKSKTIMCVNAFALSGKFEIIQPQYYLLADPQFWIENLEEDKKNYIERIYHSIFKKTNWPLQILIPFEAKTKIKGFDKQSNSNLTYRFYNKTTVNGFPIFRNLMYKWKLGMPRPQNVLIPCIMVSVAMEFKTIYLLGADHTWHETLHMREDNTLCIKDEHFEKLDKVVFNLRVINNIFTGKPVKMHEQLEAMAITFRNYHIIRQYADSRKIKIFNSSDKSYIDAFERKKLT